MFDTTMDWLSAALGLGVPGAELDFWHMATRGVVVFVAGLVIVRVVAHRRFVSRHAPFDVILGITLGAILARAVNGAAPFLPTVASAFVLAFLDRLIAVGAFRWSWFRHAVEGRPRALVRGGELDRDAMRRYHVSEEDLLVELRHNGHVESLENVHDAHLEPSGEISVIPARRAEAA